MEDVFDIRGEVGYHPSLHPFRLPSRSTTPLLLVSSGKVMEWMTGKDATITSEV